MSISVSTVTAKLYYTSLSLGCWDEIGMHGYQLGSIPTCNHPKPRPTTPMDLFDISIVLYQKEFLNEYFNSSI